MSNQLMTSIFSDVLYALGSVVLALIGNWAHKNTTTAKLNGKQTEMTIKQSIIETAVTAADRIYYDFDGHDKFIAATEMISKELRDHGIDMSSEQVKIGIEAAVEKLRAKAKTETGQ